MHHDRLRGRRRLFGDTCGALVGAMAALGVVYGRREVPGDFKVAKAELYGKPGLYRLFNRLPNEFRQRFGSTQCRTLTAQWRKTWLCKDHALFCRNLVIEAAGLAAEMAVPKDLDAGAAWISARTSKDWISKLSAVSRQQEPVAAGFSLHCLLRSEWIGIRMAFEDTTTPKPKSSDLNRNAS